MTKKKNKIKNKEFKNICKKYNIKVSFITDEFEEMERTETFGKCFIVEKCDWWNPPFEMVYNGNETNYCIQCWKFKKYLKNEENEKN